MTDPALLARRDEDFRKLQALFACGNPDKIELKGIVFNGQDSEHMHVSPEECIKSGLEYLAKHASKVLDKEKYVPLGIWEPLYGTHFMDKVFGAEVFFKDGQWYSRCLKNEVGELQRPDLEKSEAWKKAVKFAEAFLAAKVTVPSFAMPVINSTLTIAINLYGEEILVAMLTDPEAVEHDLQIIQDVCLEMYRWYMEHIPADQLQQCLFDMRAQPPGYGQICGCSTQLISPELYEKYILRLDNERLGFFPHGGMIHLCGSHTHLIPLFARMENLKSVQLNDRASEDLEYYVQGLREDQVIYLFTCEGMQKERALEIVGNRRMVLVDFYHW